MTGPDSNLAEFARSIEDEVRSRNKKDTKAKVKMPRYLRKALRGRVITGDELAKGLNVLLTDGLQVTHVQVSSCGGDMGRCPHYRKIRATVLIQPS